MEDQMALPDSTEPEKPKEKSGAGFFSVDRRMWARVCQLGINEAVSYLVLAQGTGKDNKVTSWSTKAIREYGGMGWPRAKDAITNLLQGKIISHAKGHTQQLPRYELLTLPAKKATSNSEFSPESDLVWLPSTLVTGTANGEDSPVKRLRMIGDVSAMRLLVELYHTQSLRDDGGISPWVMHKKYKKVSALEYGPWAIWAFSKIGSTIYPSAWPFPTYANGWVSGHGEHPVFKSISILTSEGLLGFVPHLWDNETEQAEIIHPYGANGEGEALEIAIGDAAHQAASAMLGDRCDEYIGDHLAPVKRSIKNVCMIGVARLRYRPQTKRTAAWFAELNESGAEFLRQYNKLFGMSTSFRNSACL
jgi:hypothetical protein